MHKSIYPFCGRENAFAGMYCKIAMENYCRASAFYEEIEKAGFSGEKIEEEHELNKLVVATIVFSAMCLESFFNNYIASVLGDNEFYDVYDNLTAPSKFRLIAKFIFQEQIDKSAACYGGIVRLFRLRNTYVHNKSKQAESHGYTAEQLKQLIELNEDPENQLEEIPPLDRKTIKSDMRDALEALKTIQNVACFFDKNDSTCFAMVLLFGEHNYAFSSSYEREFMKDIFQKLGIKKA